MVPGLNTRIDLFRIIDFTFETNLELTDGVDVTPKPEFMRLELSINHDIEKSPDQMVLTTWVYYAESEEHFRQSAYRLKLASNAMVKWVNDGTDIDLQTQSILMVIEGLSGALSLSRGVISQTTSLGMEGEFILPFVDVEQFLEQYLSAAEEEEETA